MHNFGRCDVSYLSGMHFEWGDTTECILGMIFGTW